MNLYSGLETMAWLDVLTVELGQAETEKARLDP